MSSLKINEDLDIIPLYEPGDELAHINMHNNSSINAANENLITFQMESLITNEDGI